MSTDDLIASLCADGRVDSHGGFTLDREKAREKLRTFQVAEPHRYVLHLVALAALRGATRVDFEIDSDDLWCRFDGAPLSAQDFEDLYGSSFSEARDDADRARQQLAVGLHAALALDPRHVRVTSGPPGERVRLVARHGADDTIARADGSGEVTEIHVKQRLRPGLAIRFIRHVRGGLPEALALRERCVHAHVPVTLGGELVSAGLELREPGIQFVARCTDVAGRTCVAGLRDDPDATPEVRLIRHGVWIATQAPAHLPGGLLAVVVDDGLRTDLSASGVIQGEQLDACLALVERAAEATCLAWIAALDGELHAPARARLRPVWRGPWGAHGGTTALGAALARLPWFTDLFGRPASIEQVDEVVARAGAALYTTGSFAGRLSQYPELVIAVPPTAAGAPSDDLLLLRALYGSRLRDATRELEREVRREANHRRWMARPAALELQPGPYYRVGTFRVALGDDVVEGVVGLRGRGAAPSSLRMIADGHVLCDREVTLPLPIDAALAGLAPGQEFDEPLADDRYAYALLGVLDAALLLVEKDMSQWAAGELTSAQRALSRAYLDLRHDPAGSRRWLQGFGFAEPRAAELVERAGASELPRICKQPLPVPLASARAPWLAQLERFQAASGWTYSVGEIAEALGRGEPVAWTDERVPPMPGLALIVLCLDADAQALVKQVFGAQLTMLTHEEVQQLMDEQRFLAQPEEEPALPEGCVAQVRIERGSLKAVLGVMPGETGQARVRVLVQGRFVCERTLWFPLPGVVAALRDDGLQPSADYVGIVENAEWRDAVRDLRRAAGRLAAEVVAAARERAAPAEALADVLLASFPDTLLRRAWDRLARAQEPALAESSYELLLALHSSVDATRFESALATQLVKSPGDGGGKTKPRDPITDLAQIADRANGSLDPSRAGFIAAILREIRAACGQVRTGGSLAEQVAAAAPDLLGLLPLTWGDGRPGSFADARALVREGAPIPIVRVELYDEEPAVGGTFVVSARQESWLQRLFGEAALRREGEVPPPVDAAAPAEPAAKPLPGPPRGALAHVAVRGADVSGTLWLPPEVDASECRVGLFDARGEPLKRVTLLPPLPLAGALTGPGVQPEGYVVAMSTGARAAVTEAANELYEALLRRGDPEAIAACAALHRRIGAARVPPALGDVRRGLADRADATKEEAPRRRRDEAPAEDVLGDIFDDLERAAPRTDGPADARPAPVPGPAIPEAGPATASPPPPPPEVRLLEAIRAELRALRELHDRLLSNFNLEHLRLAALGAAGDPVVVDAEAVVLNSRHPLVRRAAAEFAGDPVWVDLLASLVFTAFNVWRPEITDADELTFHASHLVRVARRIGDGHVPGARQRR